MTRFLKALFGKTAPIRTRSQARTRLGLVTLDGRVMPSGVRAEFDITQTPITNPATVQLVNTLQPGIRLVGGVLYVIGDAEDNIHSVQIDGTQVMAAKWTPGGQAGTSASINDKPLPLPTLAQPGDWATFPRTSVTRIEYYGHGGNDQFENETAIPCKAYGGSGVDALTGGTGNDALDAGADGGILEGLAGNDTLVGGSGGNRYVFAGSGLGADRVEAPAGGSDILDFQDITGGINLDIIKSTQQTYLPTPAASPSSLTLVNPESITTVYGGRFTDTIWGNSRANKLYGNESGGTDADALYGAGGNDTLDGGGGNDRLDGGTENDSLVGGYGNDSLVGAGGNDTLNGGYGTDSLSGGSNNDVLYGGDQNDTLSGDAGNDTLSGGYGNDRLDGGTEADSLSGDADHDTLSGYDGSDTLSGGIGNDSLVGGIGNDKLSGDDGNDTLDGGGGNDSLFGGAGNDRLDGNIDDDLLFGDADHDTLDGGWGNDSLFGGAGNDSLSGGDDTDTMDGQTGYDVIRANKAGETVRNGEDVKIHVRTDSPQDNNWSCGPNSAYRLLTAYGFDVTYEGLSDEAQENYTLPDYELGTPPPQLLDLIQGHRPETAMKQGATLQDVLDQLGAGKPVVALTADDLVPVTVWYGLIGVIEYVPSTLHWVTLTGFDLATQTIRYTDTNGAEKSWSYVEFLELWDWDDGWFTGAQLDAIGVTQGTMIY